MRLIILFLMAAALAFPQAQVNPYPRPLVPASGSGGSGTVTNVATTGPITGGPITTTGTIACPTCINTTAPPLTISTATTVYVCPAALSNCAYNGDGGQAATPSDSNTFAQAQNKATPWATVAHAATVLANANLYAPITIQLANTSTSCFTDSEVVFSPRIIGGEKYQPFEIGWSQVGGPYAYTDVYPTAYVEMKGNISTPANVAWTGATVPCAGTTSGQRTALRFVKTNAVVHGITFKYYDANNVDNAAVQALDHSTLYTDNLNYTGAGGSGAKLAMVSQASVGLFGPNMNSTEGGVLYCNVFSYCTTHTPAGWFSTSSSANTYSQQMIVVNEGAHFTMWGPTTQTYTGSGSYTVYIAIAPGSSLITVEAAAVGNSSITLNGANITFLSANEGGLIVNGCTAGGNTCMLSSFKKHSNVSGGGFVTDTSSLAGSSADTVTGLGTIAYNLFSSPTGIGEVAPGYTSIGVSGGPVTPASGSGAFAYDSSLATWAIKNGNATEVLPATGPSGGYTANALSKGTGTNGAQTSSSVIDNGSSVSTTEPLVTTSSVSSGASPPACTAGTAGALCMNEGTAFSNVSGAAGIYPDSTTHEFLAKTNGASSAGMLVRVQPGAIHSTALVGAVSTATLCAASAGACNTAGMYHVHLDLFQTGTACTSNTTGGVTPSLTWTDGNSVAHSGQGIPLTTNASLVALTGTMLWNATTLGAWASGDMNIYTNGTVIQYAIAFAQCSVSGTATYEADLAVTRLQ